MSPVWRVTCLIPRANECTLLMISPGIYYYYREINPPQPVVDHPTTSLTPAYTTHYISYVVYEGIPHINHF